MIAVLMPCPSSALPVSTAMSPSGLTRIQESSIGARLQVAFARLIGERRRFEPEPDQQRAAAQQGAA